MKITFNKILLGIAVLGLTAFTSCKEEEKTPETTPNTQMTGNTAGSEGTPDVNPPHGQPGHRCDMPVDASLTHANSTDTQLALMSSPSKIRHYKSTTYPPQCEPYHDCIIPVGGDLKG